MDRRSKRLKKLIGYGALFVVPLVFLLSLWFNSIGIGDGLSVFLIVLFGGIACFAFYLIYEKIEKVKEEKRKGKKDPFSN